MSTLNCQLYWRVEAAGRVAVLNCGERGKVGGPDQLQSPCQSISILGSQTLWSAAGRFRRQHRNHAAAKSRDGRAALTLGSKGGGGCWILQMELVVYLVNNGF